MTLPCSPFESIYYFGLYNIFLAGTFARMLFEVVSFGLFHTCSLVHSLVSSELLLCEIGNNCFLFSLDSLFIIDLYCVLHQLIIFLIFRYINNAIDHYVPKLSML